MTTTAFLAGEAARSAWSRAADVIGRDLLDKHMKGMRVGPAPMGIDNPLADGVLIEVRTRTGMVSAEAETIDEAAQQVRAALEEAQA